MTPCEQGRRRESSFLPRFFLISFVEGDFEKRIFQNCVRASVRPGAHSSRIGRFRLTKNGGFSEERHSIIVAVFDFKSVDFVSLKGVETKKTLPPVKTIVFL